MEVTLALTTTLNMHVVTCMESTLEVPAGVPTLDLARAKFKEVFTKLVLTSADSSDIKGVLFKDGDLPVLKIREAFADAVSELIDEASSPIITVKVYYKSKIIRTFTLSVE